MPSLLTKLLALLAAFAGWIERNLPELKGFIGGFGFREWIETRRAAKQAQNELQSVVDARAAMRAVDGMSDDQVSAELRRLLGVGGGDNGKRGR